MFCCTSFIGNIVSRTEIYRRCPSATATTTTIATTSPQVLDLCLLYATRAVFLLMHFYNEHKLLDI